MAVSDTSTGLVGSTGDLDASTRWSHWPDQVPRPRRSSV